MNMKLKAYFQISAAFVIAGSSVALCKHLTSVFPIFFTSGCSLAIALLALIPATLFLEKPFPAIAFNDIIILFFQAVSGVFIFRVFLLYGLKSSSAIEGGIITSTTPVITGFLAYLFLREKPGQKKVFGIILTVAGILLINLSVSPASPKSMSSLFGNFLVMIAVLGEGIFSVLSKKMSKNITPLFKTTLITIFAFICFIPFSVLDMMHFRLNNLEILDWVSLLYYGLIITAVAYILWFKGISFIPASSAAVFSGLVPVSAVVSSVAFMNENLSLVSVFSILLITAGIFFTVTSSDENLHPSYKLRKKDGFQEDLN